MEINGQNYGNWIFQSFSFSTIFLKYLKEKKRGKEKRGKCHNRERKAEFKVVQRQATTKSSKREKGEK